MADLHKKKDMPGCPQRETCYTFVVGQGFVDPCSATSQKAELRQSIKIVAAVSLLLVIVRVFFLKLNGISLLLLDGVTIGTPLPFFLYEVGLHLLVFPVAFSLFGLLSGKKRTQLMPRYRPQISTVFIGGVAFFAATAFGVGLLFTLAWGSADGLSFALVAGDQMAPSLLNTGAYLAQLSLLPPLTSGLLFYGVILHYLKVQGRALAIPIAALLFALSQQDTRPLLLLFFYGLILASISYLTNNVWLTVAIHFFGNLFGGTLGIYWQPTATISLFFMLVFLFLVAAGAGLYLYLRCCPSTTLLPRREKWKTVFTTPLFATLLVINLIWAVM